MTNRDVIDYLKQYKLLDKRVNRLIDEKERWRAKAEKVTPTLTGMPSGGDGENQREAAIIKMIECEEALTERIDQYVDLGREIQSEIDSVRTEDLKLLLTYRYIDGKTFEEIAVLMCYSWRHVHRLHSMALTEIKKTLQKNQMS